MLLVIPFPFNISSVLFLPLVVNMLLVLFSLLVAYHLVTCAVENSTPSCYIVGGSS